MATTKQTATAKAVTEPVAEKPQKKTLKKYDKEEMLLCRSVTPGLLLYNGHKSNLSYSWSNSGDETYVEYQDLLAAMAVRSSYIFDPLFIIEDEELLEDPKWQEVKKLYASIDSDVNVKEILGLPMVRFRRTLEEAPKGVLNAVKTEVAMQISKGEFDSYQKVKIIDEICGTELRLLME